jgi:hypothetical protein
MPDEELKLIGVRVSRDAWRTLRAAMIVEEADSMQELLRPVLEQHATDLSRQRAVKAVVKQVTTEQTRRRRSRS